MADITTLANVLSDKGSKYAVSGAVATNKAAALDVVKSLKRAKKFAKATHNTWGLITADGAQIKNDDGESGAGMIILRMLQREELRDHVVQIATENRRLSHR